MTDEPLLLLRDYGVAFAEQIVLANVSFEIPLRGLFTLVGPARCGKSTLLRTLAGIDDAHSERRTWGEATFRGRPLSLEHAAPEGEARPGMGLVTREPPRTRTTVREWLVSALPFRGSFELRAQTAWVEETLVRHGLWELVRRIDDDARSFTKAVQRRLAIVRALVPAPALLLLDDVTSDLDDRAGVDVLELVCYHASHRAVMIASHDRCAPRGRVIHLEKP